MAAPEVAIAKAALSASLFRADPTSLSRPSVEAFFSLLDAALTQCSRPNVQKSRVWILEHVAPSSARATALGKYLVVLSKSLEGSHNSKPSAKRKRLHLLYVLSDALHHTVVTQRDRKLEEALQNYLPKLLALAATFQESPKHFRKLEQLLKLWEEKAYVSSSLQPKLREALAGDLAEPDGQEQQTTFGSSSLKIAKDAPFVLPSQHGDTSNPWFDQPASTWLPHLTPNSTRPMNPDLIQPIQLSAGPADRAITEAVQTLLSDVDRIFSKGKNWESSTTEPQQIDTSQLGEIVLLDEVTGNIVGGETYYGWSRQFCEKMKERWHRTKFGDGKEQRLRSRSRSLEYRGRSRSSSTPAFKRRRRSSSASSHDRYRGFEQDPKQSTRNTRNSGSALHRRSSSRSRSRSHSRKFEDRRRSPESFYMSQDHNSMPPQGHGYPAVPLPQHHDFPPIPPPGNFPPPPPPPVGYRGPWPPLPPPPPPGVGSTILNWFPGPGFAPGGWNTNAHPPPLPLQEQKEGWGQNQQQGYAGRGTGHRNTGDYERGRGG